MCARRKVAITAVLALAAIAATASPDESPFSYGTMQSSCAPWDGPAIAITLTREPAQCKRVAGPYISLAIWRGVPIHAGQVVKFGPGTDTGWAARCAKEGDCNPAQSGTIVFDHYQERSSAAGHYELQFKSGETMKGSFAVKWCEERVICG
jgi:hypothetical protein